MSNYDIGMQEDFDNMTKDLGRKVFVYPRTDVLSYEGQSAYEAEPDTDNYNVEIVLVQPLDEENEVITSGAMSVGDVRFTFLSDTIAEEEGFVSPDEGETFFKILRLTRVGNMNNNLNVYVKGFGKKLPKR